MEAFAVGLPVVACRAGSVDELVEDGKSGFLVQFGDVRTVVDKLKFLVEHPEVWPEMSRAGRACVETYYDINKLNDRLIQIYENLLYERKLTNNVI